jgi:hypothetical protein
MVYIVNCEHESSSFRRQSHAYGLDLFLQIQLKTVILDTAVRGDFVCKRLPLIQIPHDESVSLSFLVQFTFCNSDTQGRVIDSLNSNEIFTWLGPRLSMLVSDSDLLEARMWL